MQDPYARSVDAYREPPKGFRATLRHLGPGMIIVGSIVGAGELIVTTKLGAVAGFVLLWFVLFSCFIKVVVQAELVRHTISSGKTVLHVFNDLPGPRVRRPVWLTLGWLGTVLAIFVAAIAIYVKLDQSSQTWSVVSSLVVGVLVAVTGTTVWIRHRRLNKKAEAGVSDAARQPQQPHEPSELRQPRQPTINWFMWLWLFSMLIVFANAGAILGGAAQSLPLLFPDLFEGGSRAWGLIVAVLCAALLISGKYATLEKTLVALVVTFTGLTVISTVVLQWTGFGISAADLRHGLSLGIPTPLSAAVALTALAMYAGTGVAWGEAWMYTYWCVEKGYARHAGENQPGPEWPRRAKGWIRVMYTDVFVTMVVYTVGTVCFYLLGAAILARKNLNPDGAETLATLSNIYTESLGDWAATLFAVGAFFVLFTTVASGVAGYSRLIPDALAVMGIIDPTDYKTRLRFIRIFVLVSVALFVIAYWLFENPPLMLIITSSLLGALLYPTLGLGVLYLRYREVDPRILPGRWTTAWLWVCGLAMTVISPVGILLALAIGYGWISI